MSIWHTNEEIPEDGVELLLARKDGFHEVGTEQEFLDHTEQIEKWAYIADIEKLK